MEYVQNNTTKCIISVIQHNNFSKARKNCYFTETSENSGYTCYEKHIHMIKVTLRIEKKNKKYENIKKIKDKNNRMQEECKI